jgi:hypothetical protein
MYNSSANDRGMEGLVPRVLRAVYASLEHDVHAKIPRLVGFSMSIASVELYCGQLRNLLLQHQSPFDETGPVAKDFGIDTGMYRNARTVMEALDLIKLAEKNRHVSSTNLNEASSRGHSVTCITLTQKLVGGQHKNSEFWLVDLGGLEKLKRSDATGMAARYILRSCSTVCSVFMLPDVSPEPSSIFTEKQHSSIDHFQISLEWLAALQKVLSLGYFVPPTSAFHTPHVRSIVLSLFRKQVHSFP